MELYSAPEPGHAYMIQDTESNPHFTCLQPEQFQPMYSERVPEFVLDQSMYYPTGANYGYFSTGYESPTDWDDHPRVFGLDGQDIQYTGAQIDSLPYVYYTPGYGYTESPYNPYNPYIPGAMIGVDAPFVGAQEYCAIPSFDGGVSSPAYFPMVVQSRSDIIPNSLTEPFIDTSALTANRGDGPGLKHILSSASSPFNPTPIGPASHTKSFIGLSEGNKSRCRPTKHPVIHGSIASAGFSKAASSHVIQGRGVQPVDNVPHAKDCSGRNQLRMSPSCMGDGSSSLGSSAPSRTMVDRVQSKLLYEKINGKHVSQNLDVSIPEHNPEPRSNNSKNQLVVKAYTTRAGDVDEQGYITINTEQYNREDFQVDFPNSKFFVIKSYSEDDVHKSIKYNVWSSTPNGNKKLHSAYEVAHRIAAVDLRGCPIFLFFSVNASGQFCGVAEMTGPVDFHKDMDFWQQDKWTGSFPVKWHIIKDVPNPSFRHVLLENNENKPVTNSRDTQEVAYKKGIEMLKLFKNYSSRTSLLDDFMYYENRQKILQEEKARLLIKSYGSSFIVPLLDPPRKLQSNLHLSSSEDEKIAKHDGSVGSKKNMVVTAEQVASEINTNVDCKNGKTEADGEVGCDELQVGSLTISPKQSQTQYVEATAITATNAAPAGPAAGTASVDVVAVGSMPVNVNGLAGSSGILTVGTIPLDPRALQHDEAGLSGKNCP